MSFMSLRIATAALLLALVASTSAISVDPAYSVSLYVNGLPAAYGITTCPNGAIYYYSGQCLYKYTHSPASSAINWNTPSTQLGCPGVFADGDPNTGLICTGSGRLYIALGHELSPTNGAVIRRAWNTVCHHGMGLDPTTGDVFVSCIDPPIYRIPNPDLIPNGVTIEASDHVFQSQIGADGLTADKQGIIYVANYVDLKMQVFFNNGTLKAEAVVATDAAPAHGPDGISICEVDGTRFMLTTRAAGTAVTYWDLNNLNNNYNIVSNTGGYTDWSTVGTDGCVYFTVFGVGIYRISLASGTCPCSTPQVDYNDINTCAADTVGSQCDIVSASVTNGNSVAISFGTSAACQYVNHVAVLP